MVEINQRRSFSDGFGDVLRSSAIFYVRQSKDVSTTINFMNYWKVKRGIDVAVVASTRKMDGTLLGRTRLNFDAGEVVNFRPNLGDDSEGSVEIEILSIQNLVFPYPALMAFYETDNTVSMVQQLCASLLAAGARRRQDHLHRRRIQLDSQRRTGLSILLRVS